MFQLAAYTFRKWLSVSFCYPNVYQWMPTCVRIKVLVIGSKLDDGKQLEELDGSDFGLWMYLLFVCSV